jgi:hypothetical protein
MNINSTIELCSQTYSTNQPIDIATNIPLIEQAILKISTLNHLLKKETLPISLITPAKILTLCLHGLNASLNHANSDFTNNLVHDYLSQHTDYDKLYLQLNNYIKSHPIEKVMIHCLDLLIEQKKYCLKPRYTPIHICSKRYKSQKHLIKAHAQMPRNIPIIHKELYLLKRIIQSTLIKFNNKQIFEINQIINSIQEISSQKSLDKVIEQYHIKKSIKKYKTALIKRTPPTKTTHYKRF